MPQFSQTRFPGIPLAGRAQMGQAAGAGGCGGKIGAAGAGAASPAGSGGGLPADLTDAELREGGCAGGTGRATGGPTGLPTGMPPAGRGGPTAIASTTLPVPGRAGSAGDSTYPSSTFLKLSL